jgi:hypothetical protein
MHDAPTKLRIDTRAGFLGPRSQALIRSDFGDPDGDLAELQKAQSTLAVLSHYMPTLSALALEMARDRIAEALARLDGVPDTAQSLLRHARTGRTLREPERLATDAELSVYGIHEFAIVIKARLSKTMSRTDPLRKSRRPLEAGAAALDHDAN